MFSNIEILKRINDIAERDGRYRKEGFLFVLAGLEYTVSKLPHRRHLTGQELSKGIAEYAREQYGYLAGTVLKNWGITKTDDFGELVYLMIDEGLMSKTEEDKKEDFHNVFNFDEEFDWKNFESPDFPERF
jgi:uncharacterized repeat protein (TIGR04138 family)